MDVHVPRAITQALRQRGVDVRTAQEDGSMRLPDPALLDRATALGRVLFSQDRDLLIEATHRQRAGIAFAGVIFARQLETTIGRCVADLEVLAQAGEQADFVDRVIFLPL